MLMDNARNDVTGATKKGSGSVLTDLKFAQMNLLHCKKTTATFCCDLKVNQTDVSLIQEPWVRGSKICGFGQLHNRLFYCRTGIRRTMTL